MCLGRRDTDVFAHVRTSSQAKSNPCLIGKPGVGKTAISEGVAQCIAGGYYVYDDKGTNGEKGDSGGWGIQNSFRN